MKTFNIIILFCILVGIASFTSKENKSGSAAFFKGKVWADTELMGQKIMINLSNNEKQNHYSAYVSENGSYEINGLESCTNCNLNISIDGYEKHTLQRFNIKDGETVIHHFKAVKNPI